MRIAGYLPHTTYHVTVFEMNHRFSIKIEWNGLEQWYKLRTSNQLSHISAVEKALTPSFWAGVDQTFGLMKNNEADIQIPEAPEEDFQII